MIPSPFSPTAHRGLLAACVVWLGLVVLAPLAASRDFAAATTLYAFFDPICHQISERSFHLAGHPLAACHRCVGLYLGFSLGLLVLPGSVRAREWLLEKPRRTLLFAAPMLLDWIVTFNTPVSRFSTGFLAAAPIAVFVWAALMQIQATRTAPLAEGES